jgi:hypothetical protein
MKPLIMSKEKRQRLSRWLNNHRFRIMLILILYPNIVCFTPESSDSSNTVIDFVLGLGKYTNVIKRCTFMGTFTERITNYSYIDYGGSISHKIDNLKFGLRGGGYSISNIEIVISGNYHELGEYSTTGSGVQYINPFIAFDAKNAEVSFGLLFLTQYPSNENINNKLFNDGTVQFTGILRLGNKRAFHFSSHYLSNVPIFSGGGMFDMGFGFGRRNSRTLTWVGFSLGPFENLGLGLKQNIQLSDNVDILIKGRIGSNESNLEGSISAGARYNF